MKESYKFTSRQLLNYYNESSLSLKGLSSLITLGKKYGLGKPVTYQITSYTDEELMLLKKAIDWWKLINEYSNNEWRTKEIETVLQEKIFESLKNGTEISYYGIFCPSYKKDKNSIGYTGKVGDFTKKMAASFSSLIEKTSSLGIKSSGNVYFCNLVLENYQKLITRDKNYRNDLESNFNDFSNLFIKPNIKVIKMSDIRELNSLLGESGPHELFKTKEEIANRIYLRNRIFYLEQLAWNDNQIRDRTDTLISAYLIMSRFFKKTLPDAIMVWCESSFERGLVYQTNPSEFIPVIYPKK